MDNQEYPFSGGDKLIMRNFGKFVILMIISTFLFSYLLSMPKFLAFIFSLLTSYFIVKLLDKKYYGKKKLEKLKKSSK